MVLVSAIIAASFLWFSIYLTYLHWNKMVRQVETFPGPPAFPIIGNVIQVMDPRVVLKQFAEWKNQYGHRFRIYFGYQIPTIILTAPEDVEIVLLSPDALNKSGTYYPGEAYFGEGLLTAKAVKWKILRKMMAPSFHFQALEQFLRVQNEYSRKFSSSLETLAQNKKFFNVLPLAANFTSTTILHSTLGAAPETFGISAYRLTHAFDEMARNWWNRLRRPWLKNTFLWGMSSLGRVDSKAMQNVHPPLAEAIRLRKEELSSRKFNQLSDIGENQVLDDNGKTASGKISFLDNLLLRQAEGVKILTDDEIRFNLATMVAAGYDTSALTASWLLYNLGRNPDMQELIHKELDQVFAEDADRDVTTSDLAKLKYMEACIKETLRLFPTLPLIGRQLTADVTLRDGMVLPKGSSIIINIFGMHRDAETFPKPELFDPSRFLPENETKRHPYAFIPFSAGPRNCIGMRYASYQVKTMATHLLRRYSVTAELDYSEIQVLPDIVLSPGNSNGISIALSKR